MINMISRELLPTIIHCSEPKGAEVLRFEVLKSLRPKFKIVEVYNKK
jgi:hypothetical protein